MFNEHEYERKIISVFQENGYVYVPSLKMIEMRKDFGTVILFDELEKAIKRINENITQADINAIIDQVRRVDNANLLLGNKNAMEKLSDGIKIKNMTDDVTYTFKLIDFDNVRNNSYIITDQFKMISRHINYENQVPDLVVYINGLPISVIELKSPTLDESKSIEDAYDQIKNYQANMPTLFTWNIVNAISNMHINRFGSLTASYTRFSNWRDLEKDSKEAYKYFIKNLYNQKNILMLMKDFSFYTTGDDPAKIVAGYHQFLGVLKAADKTIQAMDNKTGKGGVFWHTQGSGKSLSMVFLTRLVNNIKRKMTTIVVTDRRDLDEQLSETFQMAEKFLNQSVKQIESINDLKETLKGKIQNGVYLCTIQKFDETINKLSDRDDILIISDEAHRSHKNIHGRLEVLEDELSIKEKFGYAYYLREAFPNATFIGFTGTPIESDDYQTKSIFGDYSTKYLMTDATKDGFVVPIAYESRYAQLQIANDKKEELNKLYDNIKKEILKNTDLKSEVQKNLNKKLQKMDMIIGDPDRIKEIAKDFINHYKKRRNLLKGKAMFVTFNRKIAYSYYKEIIKIAPDLKDTIRLILTPNNQKDSKHMLELIGTDKYREESARIFKDPESDFKIAIVVDMWLTGFDAPSLDTIYLDKPIKMHNLMQTIARVNRTYTDKNNRNLVKESGLVVDYIGLWKKLEDALKFYTIGGGVVADIVPEDIEIIKKRLLKYLDNIYTKDLENKIHIDKNKIYDKNYLFDVIEEIQNIVIESKKKQQFVSKTKKLSKGLTSVISICSEIEKIKIQLLITARSMLIKRELGLIDIDFKIGEIKQLIAESIIYNKTIVNDNIDGNKISLTNIINDIINITASSETSALEADKKARATRYAINELKAFNFVRSEKLTLKLQVLLDKYDSNHISIEEFLIGLKELGIEIKQTKDDVEKSDKDVVELAFYEIMLDDDYSKKEFDKGKIEKITKELYAKIKPMLNKRWLYNETIKQNVRAEMVKLLVLENYPPNVSERIRDRLIKQLEEQIDIGLYKLEEE